MLHPILLALLWVKHGLLSNALDWGYSNSRQKPYPRYLLDLALHGTVELILTACVLWTLPYQEVLPIVAVEGWIHVVGCMVERRAGVYQQLRYHLTCEIALPLSYLAFLVIVPFINATYA